MLPNFFHTQHLTITLKKMIGDNHYFALKVNDYGQIPAY